MPQITDSNGNLIPGAFSGYGAGQVVAYTGTAGVVANALHTGKGTLTSTGVAPTDGDTVTIGNKVYTFKTALTPTEGQVLINTTAAAALLNLIRAINHTGTPDTDYKCAAAHTQVTADAAVTSSVSFRIYAIAAGVSIATSETAVTLSWADTTLVGDSTSSPGLALVMASTAAYVRIGAAPVAVTSDVPVGAGVPYFFVVPAGHKVSAVQASAGGNLTVVEVF